MKTSEQTGASEPVELTVRICRWCGQRFAWPKGSRRPGCPRCQLQIDGWPDGER